jgi:hypothetical protein
MSKFNYLKEKKRYLDSIGRTGDECEGVRCSDCMLSGYNNGHIGVCCNVFEIERQEEATEMVRKWAEEHPRITNEEKFTQVFGSVEAFANEYTIGIPRDWWNEEYKKPKKE